MFLYINRIKNSYFQVVNKLWNINNFGLIILVIKADLWNYGLWNLFMEI